jgi:hypothetical protein
MLTLATIRFSPHDPSGFFQLAGDLPATCRGITTEISLLCPRHIPFAVSPWAPCVPLTGTRNELMFKKCGDVAEFG